MSLNAIIRKRWSERCDCRMYGATVWLLRLSRAFCVAPVTLEQRRYVYNVHISRKYAVTSCIVFTVIGISVLAGMSHDIYHTVIGSNASLWAHTMSTVMMMIPNYLLFSTICLVGALGGPGRTERFINYFNLLKEIQTTIEGKSKHTGLEKILVLKLVGGMVVSLGAFVMQIVAGGYEVIYHRKSYFVQFLYSCLYLETVLSILLMMQVIFTITAVSWSFKSLNKCMRQLHDSYPIKGMMTSHKTAIVNNIHSYSNIYASLIELSKQVNASEGRMVVILLANFVFRFIICVYYCITAFVFKEKLCNVVIPACALQNLSIIVIILMLVEPCHMTHEEMKTTRVLISQILCCTESARDRVVEALTIFYKNTEIIEYIYVPLGVVVISRPFYLSFTGCLTTFLIIMYQFRLSD